MCNLGELDYCWFCYCFFDVGYFSIELMITVNNNITVL